jgi:5-hydroxyisourate hydrolase-like protein (transthyretin family)
MYMTDSTAQHITSSKQAQPWGGLKQKVRRKKQVQLHKMAETETETEARQRPSAMQRQIAPACLRV